MQVSASYLNAGAGSGSVVFFHGFQVALMMTVMFSLTQFVYWTCKLNRQGTCWQVHKPTILVLISAFLTNIQPFLILVVGSWKLCCATCTAFGLPADCTSTGLTNPPWNPQSGPRECAKGGNIFWDESYCTGQKYAVFPTVASGWAIQILSTWGGFVFMFMGVLQATQLHIKIRKKWRAIRGLST